MDSNRLLEASRVVSDIILAVLRVASIVLILVIPISLTINSVQDWKKQIILSYFAIVSINIIAYSIIYILRGSVRRK